MVIVLLDELEEISGYFRNKAIIIIDDIIVPNRSFGYDIINNQVLNYAYIKSKLEKIYSEGYFHYYK